ncbi:hypothetical protein [Tumebacillus permanentifrigoris]|uniref:Permuted papain-like amidase YaeF/Yiix C92 family enzyme n=1 Tax=Tumebacillus permanentifrigoris TaxID=378543 RepID=A0A316DZS1_9BACL|nr:hypothetical protein [Tumebacillus permanentifrigoris]PWK16050.1 hypothetical protein C7459_102297 [Tumebacillus permanentifrigoris]
MLDELVAGDILLVRGKDLHRKRRERFRWLLSAAISGLTGSEYTHAALYIGHGLIIDVDVGRCVAVRNIDELDCFDVFRVAGATVTERQLAVYFCTTQRLRKYDYGAVLSIGLERLFGVPFSGSKDDPRRWFCFELVAAAYKLSNTPWRTTGGDLENHKRLGKSKCALEEVLG